MQKKCEYCHGTGAKPCSDCKGGKCYVCEGYGFFGEGDNLYAPMVAGSTKGKVTCTHCNGTGTCLYVCNVCGGKGYYND